MYVAMLAFASLHRCVSPDRTHRCIHLFLLYLLLLQSQEWLSSYNEKVRAGSISVSDYDGVHELSLNVGWRDLLPRRDSKIPTAYRASPSILAEAMPSTKTSVRYVFTDDNRDNIVYPVAGGLFKYT